MSEPFVLEESFTTGTGDFTLESVVGYQDFAAAFGTGSSNTFEYGIRSVDFDEWETGTAYMSDSSTLVRDTVDKSSNSDNHEDFSDPDARKIITNALDPEDQASESATYVTKDDETSELPNSDRHRNLSGADLHVPQRRILV